RSRCELCSTMRPWSSTTSRPIRAMVDKRTRSRSPSCRPSACQPRLNGGFNFAVERGGCFIEHQYRRVLENDAGDGDGWALAAGQLHAALADMGVIATPAAPILECENELVGMRQSRGVLDLIIAGVRPAIANIGADRAVQE